MREVVFRFDDDTGRRLTDMLLDAGRLADEGYGVTVESVGYTRFGESVRLAYSMGGTDLKWRTDPNVSHDILTPAGKVIRVRESQG